MLDIYISVYIYLNVIRVFYYRIILENHLYYGWQMKTTYKLEDDERQNTFFFYRKCISQQYK